jgi:hypothetical protein
MDSAKDVASCFHDYNFSFGDKKIINAGLELK